MPRRKKTNQDKTEPKVVKKKTVRKKTTKPVRSEKKAKKVVVEPVKERVVLEISTAADKDKMFIMWTGIIFFMVLILSVWLFNIDAIFEKPANQKETESGFSEITQELGDVVDEIKKDWQEIKVESNEAVEEGLEENDLSADEPADLQTASSSKEDLLELRSTLEELEEKLKVD